MKNRTPMDGPMGVDRFSSNGYGLSLNGKPVTPVPEVWDAAAEEVIIKEETAAKTLLFDLDGTLTDPGLGITNAVMQALAYFGIEETDRSKLYKFIGPPLYGAFQEFYGLTEEESREAVAQFRVYYDKQGWAENTPYPGMDAALTLLRKAGLRLVVATSKPEKFAKRILEHFSLDHHFALICGATLDESRIKKGDVIAYALENCGPRDKTIMIGDRHHDVEGAKEQGLPCLGVTFGYGSAEELTDAGAIDLADTVEEMTEKLLRWAEA